MQSRTCQDWYDVFTTISSLLPSSGGTAKSFLWRLCKSLSNVWLFWPHGLYSPSSSSVHGILQTRILEWVAIPFSRGSSWPRDQTWVSHIAGRFFHWTTKEALLWRLSGGNFRKFAPKWIGSIAEKCRFLMWSLARWRLDFSPKFFSLKPEGAIATSLTCARCTSHNLYTSWFSLRHFLTTALVPFLLK